MSPERVERLRSHLVYLADASAQEERGGDYWHGRAFALRQAVEMLDELVAEEAES